MRNKLFLLILILSLSLPIQATAQTDVSAMLREGVNRVTEEAINQGNLAVIDEFFAADFVGHDSDGDFTVQDFKDDITMLRTIMPDFHGTLSYVVVEGNWAAFRFTGTGTFTNEMPASKDSPAIPPTNAPITTNLNVILRANDEGKIVEEWDASDSYSFLVQLGVFPAEEGTGEEMMEEVPAPEMLEVDAETVAARKEAFMAMPERLAAGDLTVIDEIYAADAVFYEPLGVSTVDDFKASVGSLAAAMPDLNMVIEAAVVENNVMMYRLTITGTFQNELMLEGQPIPPTGNPFVLSQNTVAIYNADGKIAVEWVEYDSLSLFAQLGLLGE
jgi:predicted ester cyclase